MCLLATCAAAVLCCCCCAQDLVAASRAGVLASPTHNTPSPSTRSISMASPTTGGRLGAGTLGEEEVAAVMHEVVHEALGPELTLAEAAEMLREVDEKHEGKISLQEVRHRLPAWPTQSLRGWARPAGVMG